MEENEIILYQTRYYDDFFGNMTELVVPTSQSRDKEKKQIFINGVNSLLEKAKKECWPYKERLTVTVKINGSEKYIKRIDIDNTLKLLLDILKSKVYVDDKQIYSIMATKNIIEPHEGEEIHGFLVGIRVLKDNEENDCIPPFYSLDKSQWIGNGKTTMWKCIEI